MEENVAKVKRSASPKFRSSVIAIITFDFQNQAHGQDFGTSGLRIDELMIQPYSAYWCGKVKRQGHELIDEGLGHAQVTGVIGMEQVVRVMVVSSAVDEWEQATFGGEINHGNGPYLTGFLDALHVGIDIFSAAVLYALIGLNVFVVRVEESTVEWGEQYDLLVREGIAEHLHRNVDATAEGVGIIAEMTAATFHQLLWLAHGHRPWCRPPYTTGLSSRRGCNRWYPSG